MLEPAAGRAPQMESPKRLNFSLRIGTQCWERWELLPQAPSHIHDTRSAQTDIPSKHTTVRTDASVANCGTPNMMIDALGGHSSRARRRRSGASRSLVSRRVLQSDRARSPLSRERERERSRERSRSRERERDRDFIWGCAQHAESMSMNSTPLKLQRLADKYIPVENHESCRIQRSPLGSPSPPHLCTVFWWIVLVVIFLLFIDMAATCEARLKREIKLFFKDPVEHIIVRSAPAGGVAAASAFSIDFSFTLLGAQVCPSPRDIKEMNFVLLGPVDSPFAGGFYHGVVEFPVEYPFKVSVSCWVAARARFHTVLKFLQPPQIKMFTPSGRFEVNKPLCLTMTNFHPESWNPVSLVCDCLPLLVCLRRTSTRLRCGPWARY
jgi:ubiquitin-protein ligase